MVIFNFVKSYPVDVIISKPLCGWGPQNPKPIITRPEGLKVSVSPPKI